LLRSKDFVANPRRKEMKFVLTSLLVLSGIVFVIEVGAEDFNSIMKRYGKEKAIEMVAAEFNKKCPMIVDQYTKINKVLPFSNRLKYQASISGIPYENLSNSLIKLKNNISTIGTNTMCSSPDTRALIDSGLVMEYEYYYQDGRFLFSYGVQKSDCL
jgi:hypothetical protein